MKPNFIFMGTPDFGVPALNYLINQGFVCLGVVTQPDRAKGRGYKSCCPPVKECALAKNLPVWQPDSVNTPEFLELLRTINPDVIVVAAFGQILKQPLLDLPTLGCINLHGSLLPKYRGAAPIQWTLANGETETGITVQHMALKVDSGDILVQAKLAIEPDETAPELFLRLAKLGGPALEKALALLAKHGKTIGEPQDESLATFAPRLSKEMGLLDWHNDANNIHNLVRGFNPWPGTYTMANEEKLKVLNTKRSDQLAPVTTKPGTIIEANDREGWLVATGDKRLLWIVNVQCANTKAMAAKAYTCGYQVGVGDRLG